MVWLRKVKTSKGRPSATLAAAAAEPWPLYALMLVLPLEPVQPALTAFGFSFTWLEIAAGIALGLTGLGLVASRRLEQLWSSPLAGLALAFLAACLLSSAVAEPPRLLPFKFSLRVATGVAAFALASATLKRADRVERLLSYLALSGVVVALVGLAEAVGLAGVDAVLSIFRAQDFEVGGALRAASTFSYPNAAAGYLVLALPGMLLVALRQRQGRFLTRWAALGAAFLMFTALLLTYSRGALLGALVTPLPFWAWGRCRGRQDAARKASVILAGFLLLAVVVMIRPSFRLRAMSEGDETWYGAEFFPASTVLRLEAGELARTGVAIVNRGKMAWEPWGKKAFHLSYRWFDLSSRKVIDLVEIEGERTALPGKVEPGERVELLAYVRAPSREGRYLLMWDVVQEQTTWFSEKGDIGKSITVVVGHPEVPATTSGGEVVRALLRASWRPGRLELWSLGLELFREHPWLGVGPDNYRWRYGPAAGRERWDTRTFSNSLYLETLATTGLLGGVPFFGLLAMAGAGMARRVRESQGPLVAAALMASLGGFLAHGVFDYLLEPTSMYLAFWMLVGAIAALTGRGRRS